jgi:hypothetical protein
VAESGRFSAVVEQELRTLAAKPRQAYREAKRFLHERVWAEMAQQQEAAAAGFLDSWFGTDTQQRLRTLAGSLGG